MPASRPYILVNVAMTVDGKLDTVERKGATISSAVDKTRVDRLRAAVDAVLVGGRTLVSEDPKLIVRDPALRQERLRRGLPENPAKVGVATIADIKTEGDFMTAGPAERYIFTTHRTTASQVERLEQAGAKVFTSTQNRANLVEAMTILHQQGIRQLLAEGGGTLLAELFRLGLVDEVMIYIAPKIFGGASAPTLADGPGFSLEQARGLALISAEKFDEEGGVLLHYKVQTTDEQG
jgi:2,5-diamino-6-(ribosylamino)-4(3H)-pyrimidinone 5'-phosphate reductase